MVDSPQYWQGEARCCLTPYSYGLRTPAFLSLPLSFACDAGIHRVHFLSQVRTQVRCLPSLLPRDLPTPPFFSHPVFSQSVWTITLSAPPSLFGSSEAAVRMLSTLLSLRLKFPQNYWRGLGETNCSWFWLGFVPMEAVDSDTICCSFPTHPFLLWLSFAPSMLCSWRPALWLQPTLGTEAVKAFKLPRMLLSVKKAWLFLQTLYLSQKMFCSPHVFFTTPWCELFFKMPTEYWKAYPCIS